MSAAQQLTMWERFERALALPEPAPVSERRPKAIAAPKPTPVLSWADCKGARGMALIRRAQAGDEALAEAIVRANEPFIVMVCKRFIRWKRWMAEDILQEGRMGFTYALLKKFDTNHGHELVTYARCWVEHYAERYIADNALGIRLPVHAQEKILAATKAGAETAEDARRITKSRAAADAWAHRQGPLSLDVPLAAEEGDSDTYLSRQVDPASPNPEAIVLAKEDERHLAQAMRALTPREREVLHLRFWVPGAESDGQTLKEIGEHFGLSRERIRQIERDAFEKLQLEILRLRGER